MTYTHERVMQKAWEIARTAQMSYGGSVKEFLAGALKQAWEEIKSNPLIMASAELIALARKEKSTHPEPIRQIGRVRQQHLHFRSSGLPERYDLLEPQKGKNADGSI